MASFTKRTEMNNNFALVSVNNFQEKPLLYRVNLEDELYKGSLVEVLFRGKRVNGVVVDFCNKTTLSKVLSIKKVISKDPLLTHDLFELSQWMCDYYRTPLPKVLKLMLPSIVRGKGKHKEQQTVRRNRSKEELIQFCTRFRNKFSKQAQVIDVMLKVSKEILFTELIEKAKVSRSVVCSLVDKGLLAVNLITLHRSPLEGQEFFLTKHKRLNEEQELAFKKISQNIVDEKFKTYLLHGITGSGKTEVYLQAIAKALDLKKGVLMLVPEIALTAQTIERFRSRFEEKIAILHYRLSEGERFDEWHRIWKGQASIVIGARSALFTPIKNLGLIIVDEEHESSYKQSEYQPCYHARDVAVVRGKICQATVVLGSATPSLESYHNIQSKKYELCCLKTRPKGMLLPKVSVVDMKKEYEKTKRFTLFSDRLLREIELCLKNGEQALLFLNRRGYHTMHLCQSCQKPIGCPHCDVSLTYHHKNNVLMCHHCEYFISPPPIKCPNCNSTHTMKFRGIGTEQVERALHAIFKEIRTLRIDADTTRHKGSFDKLYYAFKTQKADVLIGTQMIAKGLHFPGVTLACILNSDMALNIPDFRAQENVFQLITQVAGRSGRGDINGKVIVQTVLDDHMVIQTAKNQDYELFYKNEIKIRSMFSFPPISHIVKYQFFGKSEQLVQTTTLAFHKEFEKALNNIYEMNPVVPSGCPKIKEIYRFQFYIRGPSVIYLHKILSIIEKKLKIPSNIRFLVDVDPLSTFF